MVSSWPFRTNLTKLVRGLSEICVLQNIELSPLNHQYSQLVGTAVKFYWLQIFRLLYYWFMDLPLKFCDLITILQRFLLMRTLERVQYSYLYREERACSSPICITVAWERTWIELTRHFCCSRIPKSWS